MRKTAGFSMQMETKFLKSKNKNAIHCNVCDVPFHPNSKFERFCTACKNKSKLFHFSEWLPEHCIMA